MHHTQDGNRPRLDDLSLDLASGVYVFDMKGALPPNEIAYSDGAATEEKMMRALKMTRDVSDGSEELIKFCRDWPSAYHFGPGRSNFLRAISLPMDARVLELGAGCGAVTRYLGENFSSVDAVEGSFKRASIARERCRGLDNVKIYCSDIDAAEFGQDYDLVVMAGVMEYAPTYLSGGRDTACRRLLEIAGSALKLGGKLVLAIENRIGIKYWSGCPEDHTGRVYDSIHGYPVAGPAVTFSKKELSELFPRQLFGGIDFYYCFPDYKFASVILSDTESEAGPYLHNWVKVPFPSYGARRIKTFHEGLAVKMLSENGLLKEFANSFVVVACRGNVGIRIVPDWIAKSFNVTSRKRQFRCVTVLKATHPPVVEKKALDHIETEQPSPQGLVHRNTLEPWVKGDLLVFEVYKAFLDRKFSSNIIRLVKEYYKELLGRYYSGKNDEHGFPLVKGGALDFIFRNIIKQSEGWGQIDMEWTFQGDLTADYVLYRNCLDIVEAANVFTVGKTRVTRLFCFRVIKAVCPKYSLRRHRLNVKLERNMQMALTTGFRPEKFAGKDNIMVHFLKVFWGRFLDCTGL